MGTPGGAQAIFPTPSNGQGGVHGIYNITGFEGENGSDVASEYVNDNAGSITYVETAYALRLHRPCVSVENPAGDFVQPSATADAIALTQDQLAPDLERAGPDRGLTQLEPAVLPHLGLQLPDHPGHPQPVGAHRGRAGPVHPVHRLPGPDRRRHLGLLAHPTQPGLR